MGISTFAHSVTAEEIRALSLVTKRDDVLKGVVERLCDRPFFGVEAGGKGEQVDVVGTIRALLEGGGGSTVRLAQKTKFWEASVEGSTVTVRYGKKNTAGQTHVHSAASAEEAKAYMDKKVREKCRTGYKPVEDAVVSEFSKQFERGESSQKKAKSEPPVLHRADFDKGAELVCFLVSRALGKAGAMEMFEALFENRTLGEDVCYGPVYVVSPEAVAAAAPAVLALTLENVLAQFQFVDATECYGGLTNVTQDREGEYATIHFKQLQELLAECVEHNCGLLMNFW